MSLYPTLANVPDGFHSFPGIGDLLGYREEFDVDVAYGVLKENGEYLLALIVEPDRTTEGEAVHVDDLGGKLYVKRDTPLGDDTMHELFCGEDEDGDAP